MNQDNGLSLSNSKKNTDDLFAELFSVLQSSDNLTNTNIEIESIVGKSENNLKNDFVTENTEVSNLEIEAAKYLAETFYKEIGIVEEKDNNTINKITEFIPKVSTKPINTKNVPNKDSSNKLPYDKVDNEFLEKTHFQVNVVVKKLQNSRLKKEKIEVDNFPTMKKIPEVKKIDIKNEKENITNVQSKNISNNLIEKKKKKG